MPDPGQHSPCGARRVGRPEQIREGKRPGDGDERAEEIAAGNSKQSARMNDGKLNEQQSRRDRADHEHGGGICGNELPDVPNRHRRKGHRGTECGEQDQYDGEREPPLAPARRQRRQQNLLLVQRAGRSGLGHAGSRVAGGAVLSDARNLKFSAQSLSPSR